MDIVLRAAHRRRPTKNMQRYTAISITYITSLGSLARISLLREHESAQGRESQSTTGGDRGLEERDPELGCRMVVHPTCIEDSN